VSLAVFLLGIPRRVVELEEVRGRLHEAKAGGAFHHEDRVAARLGVVARRSRGPVPVGRRVAQLRGVGRHLLAARGAVVLARGLVSWYLTHSSPVRSHVARWRRGMTRRPTGQAQGLGQVAVQLLTISAVLDLE